METHPGQQPFICQECGKSFTQKHSLKQHTMMHRGQNPFQCSECDKGYRKHSHLKRHFYVAKHSTGKLVEYVDGKEVFKRNLISQPAVPSLRFKCIECNQFFRSSLIFSFHRKLHTGELPYKCDLCDKTFMQRYRFLAHQRTHREEKPNIIYKCNECGKTFKNKQILQGHAIVHTGERPFQCKQCNKKFSRENCLRKHHRTVHAVEKRFMCDECGKSFCNMTYLNKHMLTHAKEKPFRCKECGRGFASESNLKRHVRIHTGELPYLCSICGHRFRQSNSFKEHNIKKHTGEGGQLLAYVRKHQAKDHRVLRYLGSNTSSPNESTLKFGFKCKECGEGFPPDRISNYNLHTMTPTGEKIFPCTVCDGTFSNFLALLEHLNLHCQVVLLPNCSHHSPNQMNKACCVCEKSFATCQNRKQHMKAVLKEKFKCSICGRGFVYRTCLETHMRSHTGEKPFVCSTCGKAFSNAANLSRHNRIHTGERPYKCSQCDKDFNQRSSLTTHMRTHTGEKPYKCVSCDQAFSEKRSLQKHILQKHVEGN